MHLGGQNGGKADRGVKVAQTNAFSTATAMPPQKDR